MSLMPESRHDDRRAPRYGKGGRYHHGDLRVALINAAIELIAERGVRNFSLAEASRRLGVAASAPYAHFAGREELLAAVTVHAYELFYAELLPELNRHETPADRLAEIARTYVRFAGRHRPLFEMLFEAGLDKKRYPEIKAAEAPIDDAFLDCVRALFDAGETASADLAIAIEATAHGYAAMLLDGALGQGEEAIDLAAERAARATLALVRSRDLLG
jgi:AcrR family transcriptional regulator